MTTALLLRLEARRNVGLWAWPALVGLALLFWYGDGLAWRVTFWAEASVLVRDGLILIGPGVAVIAAWMGGRERRRKMDDLLATTPRPPWARWGVTWAATTLWGALAYVVAGAYLLVLAIQHTTWGAPVMWPILVGLVAIPAYAAVGYALGSAIPSRFTVPLVAIALLVLTVAAGWGLGGAVSDGPTTKPSTLDALHYLSPVATLDSSVWYGVRPDVGWPEGLFLLGLTGLALGGLALRNRRDRSGRGAWGALLAGGSLAAAAVAILLGTSPPSALLLGASRFSNVSYPLLARYETPIPYTPVCAGAPVRVCVHPAYRSYLAAEAPIINRLVAPLLGVPGAPVRAEQRPHNEMGVIGRVLAFVPNNGNGATDQTFFGPVAQALVANYMVDGRGLLPGTCPGDPTLQSCWDAQSAIGIWLVRQAGLRLDTVTIGGTVLHPYFGGADWSLTSVAADRFGKLGRDRQRAWLRAHYDALNKVHIRLQDIP